MNRLITALAPMALFITATSFAGIINIPAGTSAVTVSGTVLNSQTNNWIVYHFVDSNGNTKEGIASVASTLPSGIPLSATFSLPASVSSGYATLLGIYSPGLVAVGMTSTAGAAALGSSFDAVFGTGISESSVASALASKTAATLISFLNTNQSLFPHFDGTGSSVPVSNVKFSNGQADGSLTVSILSGPAPSATPEPSSFLLAGTALLFLIRKRLS